MNAFQERLAEYIRKCRAGESAGSWRPYALARLAPGLYAVNGDTGEDTRLEWDVYFDRTQWELRNENPEDTPPGLLDEAHLGWMPDYCGLLQCRSLKDVIAVIRRDLRRIGAPAHPVPSDASPLSGQLINQLALGQF